MPNAYAVHEMRKHTRRKKLLKRVFLYLFLTLIAVVMAFPFLWMISSALKAKDEKITPAEMLDIRKQLGAKYEEVSRFPVISEYLAAKKKVEDILAKTNSIIRYYVTGETDEAEGGCGGNCSSCGGCH